MTVYACPECGHRGALVGFLDRPCTAEMEKERAAEYADSMRRVYLESARTLLGMARIDVVPDGGDGSGVRLYPVAGARAVRVVTVLDGQEHERMPVSLWTEESKAQRVEYLRCWGYARQALRDGGWRHVLTDTRPAVADADPLAFEAPDGIENEPGQPVRFAGHRLPTTPELVEVPMRGGVESVEGFRCVDCGQGCFLAAFADLRCTPPTPEPEPVAAADEGPLVDAGILYDVHDDEGLKQRGINPGTVKARTDKAGDAVAREPGGVLLIEGIRYVPNPARRRITADGQLSIPTTDMADEYTVHDADKQYRVPAPGVRAILRRLLTGGYAAVGSAWVETDEQGREVIYAKHIPSELATRYVPVTEEKPGSLLRLEPLAGSKQGRPTSATS